MAVSTRTLLTAAIAGLAGCGLTYAMMSGAGPISEEASDFVSDAAETHAQDGRLLVFLSAPERAHVRQEMLAFLQGVQTVSYTIADADRDLLEVTASRLSRGAGDPVGKTMRQKVPPPFREMSQNVRREFGTLATMADEASFVDLQLQLSATLSGCSACHGSYSVAEQNP